MYISFTSGTNMKSKGPFLLILLRLKAKLNFLFRREHFSKADELCMQYYLGQMLSELKDSVHNS